MRAQTPALARHNSIMATLKEMLGMEPYEVPAQPAPLPHQPVPEQRLSAAGLRHYLSAPSPWEPEMVRERRWGQTGVVKPAAVLVPVVKRDELTVLLTHRASHLRAHAGQVAFPGGKIDESDRDAVWAALREAHEEVGLDMASAEIIGALPDYFTGTGYVVTPVVALIEPPAAWRPNPSEVGAIFEVPLKFLMNAAHHRTHEAQILGEPIHWWSMPYDDGHQTHYIWGATAAMLRNLYRLLSAPGEQ